MFCMAALVVRYDDASVLMDFDYIPHAVALARVAISGIFVKAEAAAAY
jgi:hypothetical protein